MRETLDGRVAACVAASLDGIGRLRFSIPRREIGVRGSVAYARFFVPGWGARSLEQGAGSREIGDRRSEIGGSVSSAWFFVLGAPFGTRDARRGTRDARHGTRDAGRETRDAGRETRDARRGTRARLGRRSLPVWKSVRPPPALLLLAHFIPSRRDGSNDFRFPPSRR